MDQSEVDLVIGHFAGDEGNVDKDRFKRVFGFELIDKNVPDAAFPAGMDLLKKKVRQRSTSPRKCRCQPRNGIKCLMECRNAKYGVECPESCDVDNGECQNRAMSKGLRKKIRLVSRGDAGSGVVASEYIAKGEYISEYVGVVYKYLENPHHGSSHYVAGIAEKKKQDDATCVVVEATEKGNASRFYNHSHSPNAKAITKRVGNELRHAIFALKPIPPGEEVTFSYGSGFRSLGIELCNCCDLNNCPDVFVHLRNQIIKNDASEEHRLADCWPLPSLPCMRLQPLVPSPTDEKRDPIPRLMVSIPLHKLARVPEDLTRPSNQ